MRAAQENLSRPQIALGGVLASLWRAIGSPRTSFYLLVIVAVCSVIGILIPQGQLPGYYVRNYGELGANVISHLGIDRLYSSAWYVTLLALLPLNVIARVRKVWQLACHNFTGPKLSVLQRRWRADSSARWEGTVGNNFQVTQEVLASALRKRGYMVEPAEGEDDVRWLVGRKRRYAAFGIVVVHLAVLVIAIGVIIGVWPGLAVDKVVQITEGETYKDPGGDFDFALTLNDFSIEYYPDGGPVRAYKSDLSIWDGGQEVKRETLVVNGPLLYDHFNIFQAGWGLAGFTLGITLNNGGVETVKFPLQSAMEHQQQGMRQYYIPLEESAASIDNGKRMIIATAFLPEAWEQDSNIIGSQSEFRQAPAAKITVGSTSTTEGLKLTNLGWVKYGHPVTYNGTTIELADIQHYTRIGLRRDYGLPLVWFGFITLLVGLVLTLYLRPQTIVARLAPTGEQVSVALAAFRTCAGSGQRIQQQPAGLQRIVNSVNAQLTEAAPDLRQAARSVATGQTTGAGGGASKFGARHLLDLDALDELTYRIVAFAFPLLTLVIMSGSVWAQTVWGRWWGWDPKETAALVTWLIYAAYFHGRLRASWRGGPAAAFAILGFATILFCFAGINLVPSLHSHGGQILGEGGRVALGGFRGTSPVEMWLTYGLLWAYVLALLAYIGFATTHNFAIGMAATSLSWVGLLMLTTVLGLRMHETGRLPFDSGYSFTLCFIWCISIVHLVVERIVRTKVLGVFVLIIVLGLAMYAYLMFPFKGSIPLMPALQNKFWLHFHVSMAVITYGALALSCATAIMYFVKRKRADWHICRDGLKNQPLRPG